MAARATWKGFLKISLVNIPIKVFPATESSGSIAFNQLHGECQTRIQQKRWCPHCNREVPNSEIVKGYEFEKGRYVIMSDEDFDTVRPESTRVIDLVQFADAAAIDPMYVDRTYYLAPDGGMAADAFALALGVALGLLVFAKLVFLHRQAFGESMMFLYYAYFFPMSLTIGRGFYEDGIWAETTFIPYNEVGGISWREGEHQVTLIVISRLRSLARRLTVPGDKYGAARRLLRDKIGEHAIHFTGTGLDLGAHDERDEA